MDIFKFDLAKLPLAEQEYFKSPAFLNLSPSAKVAIARERLSSKPSANEVEAKKQQEHEGLLRVYADRARVEEARQATMREHLAERKRRHLN